MSHSKNPVGVAISTRQTWIDQARWAAIVLVVVGHAVGQLRDQSGLAIIVSNYVYIFHIPVFVLLAGWGARRAEADGRGLSKIWWQLLLPYIVFQLIAFGMNWIVNGKEPSWSFTNQSFGLWFLVALAGWRLLGPWFSGLRWGPAIALCVALVAGLSPQVGGWLSIARILYFLPLFVFGPWLVEQISVWRNDVRWRCAAGLYLLAIAIIVVALGNDFWRTPFLGRSSYEDLQMNGATGMLVRVGLLALATITAAAFMLVLPGNPTSDLPVGKWVATAGKHTMYPYLLHLQILTLVAATDLESMGSPTLTTCTYIAGAVAVCCLVQLRPVRALFRPLVEPSAMFSRRAAR